MTYSVAKKETSCHNYNTKQIIIADEKANQKSIKGTIL